MKHIEDDIFKIERGILVHGCNAKGVMGSGIALTIKNRFPSAFLAYREAFNNGELRLGSITVVRPRDGFFIVNGVTQDRYGREQGVVYVNYNAVRCVFSQAAALAKKENLPLIFPLIGCGLAGGAWATVSKIIEEECQGVETILCTLPENKNTLKPIKP